MIARDEQLEDLFHRALDVPAAEREAWVRAQSGVPDATRAAVLELLKGDSSLGSLGTRMSGMAPVDARIGPYEVVAPLGSGGGGTVYLARRIEPPRRMAALKIARSPDPEVIRRLQTEQAALARTDHPGITAILECGDLADGRAWFAMEYVPGIPITDYVDSTRASTQERVRLMAEACDAVMHAHSRAILHRDLKPANLLIDTRGDVPRPVLIDLGLAKSLDGSSLERAAQTEVGRLLGTPEFMAPEQARGGAADVRMDVFSLGCLLGALLTGRPPRRAEEMRATGLPLDAAIRKVPIELPSESQRARDDRETGIRRWQQLDQIVEKAVAIDPNARYQSVREFRDDLVDWLRDRSPRGVATRWLRLFGTYAKDRRLVAVLAVAAIVAAALQMIVSFTGGSSTGPAVRASSDPPVRVTRDLPVPMPVNPKASEGGRTERAVSRLRASVAAQVNKLVLDRLNPQRPSAESVVQFADRVARIVRDAEIRGEELDATVYLQLAEAQLAASRHQQAMDAARTAEARNASKDALVAAHAELVLANVHSALREDSVACAFAEKAHRHIRSALPAGSRERLELELSCLSILRRAGPIEAERALSELWATARTNFGEDDPLTIGIEQARAGAMAMQGKDGPGLQPNRDAYERARRVLGDRNYVTLQAASWLILMLGYSERHEESIALSQRVMPDVIATVGPDAPITLNIAMNTAAQLLEIGRAPEAVASLRDTHARYCRLFDRGHRWAIHVEELLIDALMKAGSEDECVERLRYHLEAADDPRDPERKARLASSFRDLVARHGLPDGG